MQKQRFIRKSDGNTAIEFALIAPMLFLLVMGILEFALIMFAAMVVENAATSAARVGLTGRDATDQYGNTASRLGFVRGEVDRLSGGLLDTSKLTFDPKAYGTLDNISGDGADGIGNADEAAVYELRYDWKLFTPLLGQFFGADNTYSITSTVIVKNEKFD